MLVKLVVRAAARASRQAPRRPLTASASAEKRFLTALSVRPPIVVAILVQLLPHLR